MEWIEGIGCRRIGILEAFRRHIQLSRFTVPAMEQSCQWIRAVGGGLMKICPGETRRSLALR